MLPTQATERFVLRRRKSRSLCVRRSVGLRASGGGAGCSHLPRVILVNIYYFCCVLRTHTHLGEKVLARDFRVEQRSSRVPLLARVI